VKWVGSTDLVVCFLVVDAATGLPIPNATIDVKNDGGLCTDQGPQRFTIVTGVDGIAQQTCQHCICFGSRSLFEHTYIVHLPWWYFTASAPGYSNSEPEFLDLPLNQQRVQRGNAITKVSIPIRLKQSDHRAGQAT
jgi:hypothetical protein